MILNPQFLTKFLTQNNSLQKILTTFQLIPLSPLISRIPWIYSCGQWRIIRDNNEEKECCESFDRFSISRDRVRINRAANYFGSREKEAWHENFSSVVRIIVRSLDRPAAREITIAGEIVAGHRLQSMPLGTVWGRFPRRTPFLCHFVRASRRVPSDHAATCVPGN